jgi:hypothetical protein
MMMEMMVTVEGAVMVAEKVEPHHFKLLIT